MQTTKTPSQRMKDMKTRLLLRKSGDPVLKQVCDKLVSTDDLSFLQTMKKVCRATSTGVGLAAPQIGITKRAILVMLPKQPAFFMINPEIVSFSHETSIQEEGCLSYPGIWKQIERPVEIIVSYQNEKFESKTDEFKDMTARVILHECDHLDGICKVGE